MGNAHQSDGKTYQFKAEIAQLLDILVHSLYKEREIFLRELVSNASDALTRIHFEMLTNQEVLEPEAELAIHIDVIEKDGAKELVIKDSGIGMTYDELVQDLGTIAQSGALEFLERISEEDVNPSEIIGQFGVGFYSVFMVADEVRVVSRSFRTDAEAAAWVSTGGDEFVVEKADKVDRGTEIHIKLNPEGVELANEWTLRQIVKKHSDFIAYPIYVGDEQANQQKPLWRKSPSETSPDERKQFYQQLTMDFEAPLATIHLSSDAPLHLRTLLFVPAKREKSVLNLRQETGPKLYSHNVLIQEYSQDLLPNWLGFVDGVVESEDLPLNVSRETTQNTRIMRQLAKSLRARVLRELNDLAEGDDEIYNQFWEQFGRVLKEGLATDPEARDDILPLLRFHSSHSDGGLTTLDDYLQRQQEGQEDIYFVLGDDPISVAYSPHLDPLKARGLEVLYLVDPVDPFISPHLSEYKDKPLRNIDDPDLELPELAADDEAEVLDDKPESASFNLFIGRCVTALGDRVIEVRESKVLRDSPVRLVTPKDQPNKEMHRIYRYLGEEYEIPKKVFEVNSGHPLIANLVHLVATQPDDRLIDLSIEQLYDSALLLEGLHPNPPGMLPRIQRLLEVATGLASSHEDDS